MMDATPYRPFPMNFTGDKLHRSFCEIDDGPTSKFIVIRATPYMRDKETEESLLVDGIMTWNDLYPELDSIGYMPSHKDTYWLYRVDVCDIDKEYLKDSDTEVFATKAKNCAQYHFDRFSKAISLIKEKYNITPDSFKKSWETNYPQY